MPQAYILGLAGLQGSGKTTLARGLASALGWEYVAESQTAMRYLPELFHKMDRLAFEVQVGFLCNKAVMILDRLRSGTSIVLDRTLYEDWQVFAKYFRDIAKIDQRAYDTYVVLAEYFTHEIPPPVLTLYCDCPISIAKQRIDDRKRESQKHYPPNHMEHIDVLYKKWLANYDAGPLATVNSVVNDFRQTETVNLIAQDILGLFQDATPADQLDLFTPTSKQSSKTGPLLVKLIRGELVRTSIPTVQPESSFSVELPTGRFAYVAAPFTQFAADLQKTDKRRKRKDPELLALSLPHGTIPVGTFRRALLGLERSLARKELQSLIPHRDVNLWGKKTVSAADVFAHCSLAVQRADFVVAVLGTSSGVHYEVGLAQGLGKPVLVIHCDEIPPSYIATGIPSIPPRTIVCRCRHIREIPSVLERPEVDAFLRSH